MTTVSLYPAEASEGSGDSLSVDMGAASSKPVARGMVISLDALGTLYRFRKPVAAQYLDVARKYGLQAPVELPELEKSFRSAYKRTNSEFPNYGKGALNDPEAWWTMLVNRTFQGALEGEPLPEDLGHMLYDHFSSSAAYELYPDVRPFFEAMSELRAKYTATGDPMIILGIVTNSDPRVRRVLNSMSLRVGPSQMPTSDLSEQMLKQSKERIDFRRTGLTNILTPWRDFWSVKNHIDFLATSYDAGTEKPNRGIFQHAWRLAAYMPPSRAEQQMDDSTNVFNAAMTLTRTSFGHMNDIEKFSWIHIGDEYVKDVQGAEDAGLEALHLVREGEGEPKEGVKTVSSLEEVAAIVSLMAAQNFDKT